MNTVEQIIALLEDDDGELRASAALVLARLQPVEEASFQSLLHALERAEGASKCYILDAIATTGRPERIEIALSFVEGRGPLVEQSIRILRDAGSEAVAPILERHEGQTGWRSGAYIKILAGIPDRRAIAEVLERLPDAEWEQARATSLFLRESFGRLSSDLQGLIFDKCLEVLEENQKRANQHAIVTSLRILEATGRTIPATLLAPFTGNDRLGSVQRHALELLAQQQLKPSQIRNLQPMLRKILLEVEHEDSAELAMSVLDGWSEVPLSQEELLELAHSRQIPVARFGLRRLASDVPESAREDLRPYLTSRHPEIRGAAIEAFVTLDGAAEEMLDLFNSCDDDNTRNDLVDALGFVYRKDETLFRKHFDAHLSSIDRGERCDVPRMRFLAAMNRDGFCEGLLEPVRRWLSTARFHEIVSLLQPLVHWRLATEELRLILALANLRASEGDFVDANPQFKRCINILSPLARTDGYDLATSILKESLEQVELLVISKHLANRGSRERSAAVQIFNDLDPTSVASELEPLWDALESRFRKD